MHLYRHGGDLQTHLGAKAFDQGHHKFVKALVLFARLCIRVVVRHVKCSSGHRGQRAAALHIGAHGHEHPAHIRMVDDGGAGVHRAIDRSALHPIARELRCLLVGPLGHGNALHAHAITGGVHHNEHVLQAAVFLTYQKAHGTRSCAIGE